MNRWLFTLAALAALGTPAARAQYYRPPIGAGLYGGPLAGPGAGGYNPSISGVYPGFGMYPGMGLFPGLYGGGMGRPGGMGTGVAPGMYTGQQLQLGGSLQGGELLDPTSENITGHPTRFNSYSRYFFNQGGSTYTVLPTGTLSVYGLTGADARRNTSTGARPQQGMGIGSQQGPLVNPRQ